MKKTSEFGLGEGQGCGVKLSSNLELNIVIAIKATPTFSVEILRFCVEIRKVLLRRNTEKMRRNTVGIVGGKGEVWGLVISVSSWTVTKQTKK
ncbi:MAG: hypothetical protein JNL95_06215 [Chitinophagales bacterium]|nr:hypothetical protein [Chitinophagales bacterium]